MKYYPYYYFVHQKKAIYKSLSPVRRKLWWSFFFCGTFGLIQAIFYMTLYEKYINNHDYWVQLRKKSYEEQAAYDLMIKINNDFKPNIIKEFSSF